jgi:hypothetical protein
MSADVYDDLQTTDVPFQSTNDAAACKENQYPAA